MFEVFSYNRLCDQNWVCFSDKWSFQAAPHKPRQWGRNQGRARTNSGTLFWKREKCGCESKKPRVGIITSGIEDRHRKTPALSPVGPWEEIRRYWVIVARGLTAVFSGGCHHNNSMMIIMVVMVVMVMVGWCYDCYLIWRIPTFYPGYIWKSFE